MIAERPGLGRYALLIVVTVAVAIAAAPSSIAQPVCNVTWDGGAATNSWHDALNWDTNAVPGATSNVCIPASTDGRRSRRTPARC